MVAPLLAAAVAAPIAAGLIGYMNTNKALKANAAERARISALVDKIQQPNFDFSKLTPEDYKIVGEYTPQYINLLEEAAPELVKDSAAAKEGMEAQRAALQRFRQIAEGGPDIEQQVAAEQAARAQAQASQGTIGALNELQARQGRAPGSGLNYAAALSAAQAGGLQAAQTGQAAALDAYRNRLQSMRDAANLGGSVTGQERQMSGNNAGIINAYNQRLSNLRQRNVDLGNEAQLKNLGIRQTTSDRNIGQANDASKFNLENFNRLQQQRYDNAMRGVEAQSGVSNASQQANLQGAGLQNQALMGAAQGITAGSLYNYNQPAPAPAPVPPQYIKEGDNY